jgi:hypothetical protein
VDCGGSEVGKTSSDPKWFEFSRHRNKILNRGRKKVKSNLEMVVENDVISAVNSHVQVGDALDGLADHVQVLPAMVV